MGEHFVNEFEGIDPIAAMQIMLMRQKRAELSEEIAINNYTKVSRKCNKLTADLARARRQNAELLRTIDNITGYHHRVALPAPEVMI